MITLPYKGVPYICQDALKVILLAVFVEVVDKRLISLIDQTTIEKRMDIVRKSDVFDMFIDALDIFGEDDFIEAIKPSLIVFTNELALRIDYRESLEDNFKELF